MSVPSQLKYTTSHEWVKSESDGTVTVGITQHAQELLGDMVFVELPKVGRKLNQKEECAVVESVKAAADVYSPLAGEVVAANSELESAPEKINQDPYTAWLFKLKLSNAADLESYLMPKATKTRLITKRINRDFQLKLRLYFFIRSTNHALIPHTEEDAAEMLAKIGANSIEELFDEIPPALNQASYPCSTRLDRNGDHPAHARTRASRWVLFKFLLVQVHTSTISQPQFGKLQRGENFILPIRLIRRKQVKEHCSYSTNSKTMMASLTGMDVSNASLYDGASALAESALMVVRQHKTSRRILIPQTAHPNYRKVLRAIVSNQQIEVVEIPFCEESGQVLVEQIEQFGQEEFAALVIPQPNFFGVFEQVDALTNWAHQKNALVIAVVNPMALALLTPPGEWGDRGVDIAVGEGQPLGIPLLAVGLISVS